MATEKEFIAYLPSADTRIARITGTIQEVLNSLASNKITARRLIYWSDDGTDAIALYHRLR